MHSTSVDPKVFDYRAIRMLVGIIAIALPWLVEFGNGPDSLNSISASYWEGGAVRNIFVGSLFAIAAFLFAYQGKDLVDAVLSKLSSVAAIAVAMFPTSRPCPHSDQQAEACRRSCDALVQTHCEQTAEMFQTHEIAAIALFLMLAYIVFASFLKPTWGNTGKRQVRAYIYAATVLAVIGSIVAGVGVGLLRDPDQLRSDFIYWAEFVALHAIGAAWLVSGKFSRLIADDGERLRIL
ncbi:MAG: hypothetical protein AAGH76_03540 [Pseudomonadota bacterium]